MPVRPLTESTLDYHRGRILALDESTPALWGGMTATSMLSHLRALTEASLGDLEVPQVIPPLVGRPVGLFIFYVLPVIPRGKPGSKPPIPALCPVPDGTFENERQSLLDVMERFVALRAAEPGFKTRHPILGRTTLARWSRVHGVHNRHHYRQFGLEA